MLRQSLAFVAAASMAVTPVLAQPAAAPLSVARAGASTADSSQLRSGADWFPALLFAAIVIAGILTATGIIFDDDDPESP